MTTLRTEENRNAIRDMLKGVSEFHHTGKSDNTGGMFVGRFCYDDAQKPVNRGEIWIEAKRIVMYVGKSTPIYNAIASAYDTMRFDRTNNVAVIREIKRKKATNEDSYQLPTVDELKRLMQFAGLVPYEKPKASKSRKKNTEQAV